MIANQIGLLLYCVSSLYLPQVNDLCELKRHIYGDSLDRHTINRFVGMLFPPCNCRKLFELQKLRESTNQQQVGDGCFDMYQQELDASDIDMFFADEMLPEGDEQGTGNAKDSSLPFFDYRYKIVKP